MKILFLIGSGRKQGNTAQAAGLVESALLRIAAQRGMALETETFFLGDLKLEPCRGCRACFDRGEEKCPARDDFLSLKARMLAADGLVAASPVYVDDVSGLVKTWIDRLAHVCHRPEFAGKCALALVTVGSSPTRHALGTLEMALSTWGYHLVGGAGFKMGARMAPGEAAERFYAQAERAAGRLFQAVAGRAYARPSLRSLLTFKIQQYYWRRHPYDDFDRAYWREQGWLDPRCEYYVPHQAGRLKVAVARATGGLLARWVI